MFLLGLIVGVVAGWITKIPFLMKWYRELRDTKDYQQMRLLKRYEELHPEENKTQS